MALLSAFKLSSTGCRGANYSCFYYLNIICQLLPGSSMSHGWFISVLTESMLPLSLQALYAVLSYKNWSEALEAITFLDEAKLQYE